MGKDEIVAWLQEDGEEALARLWRKADDARRANVGDAVHLRGLIEISNVCVRHCSYCGLRAANSKLHRYRMSAAEIMACVGQAVRFGCGTVVMQAGEDDGILTEWMGGLVRRIKKETDLAVTLSLGERPVEDFAAWREAGADRYLLRFETSNRLLYEKIHSPRSGGETDRLAILKALQGLGYETGSGAMIGIPGQTYDDVANDLLLFRDMDLDMIGVGPYIPHPDTPLGKAGPEFYAPDGLQAPGSEAMTYKVVALSRLLCPEANIPSTTALATIHGANGRELGLLRGANVVMPNLTPVPYRSLYEIYPNKACIRENPPQSFLCLRQRVRAIGRTVGTGKGGRTGRKRA